MASSQRARFLVDTDIFIDHLRGSKEISVIKGDIAYSAITRCELFSGDDGNEDIISLLLAPFIEVPVDRGVAELAGRIRRSHRIRTPDALIAATALLENRTLVTRNIKDFEAVEGLGLASVVDCN